MGVEPRFKLWPGEEPFRGPFFCLCVLLLMELFVGVFGQPCQELFFLCNCSSLVICNLQPRIFSDLTLPMLLSISRGSEQSAKRSKFQLN